MARPMSYERALATIPESVGHLEVMASELRQRAAALEARSREIVDAHINAVRPVSCDTCKHAVKKVREGKLRWCDLGWKKPCAGCARPGHSLWERRPK